MNAVSFLLEGEKLLFQTQTGACWIEEGGCTDSLQRVTVEACFL
jgi:hypothetical protein